MRTKESKLIFEAELLRRDLKLCREEATYRNKETNKFIDRCVDQHAQIEKLIREKARKEAEYLILMRAFVKLSLKEETK